MHKVLMRLLPWFVLPVMLSAQRWEFGPAFGYVRPGHSPLGSLDENSTKADRDTVLKAAPAYGGNVTWNTAGYYGFEASYLRSKSTLRARVTPSDGNPVTREGKINIDYIGGNGIAYFMPAGEKWRPFITAGGAMIRYGEPKFAEWTAGPSRTFGGNFGFGIKLLPVKNFIIRIDLRDYIGGKPYDLSFVDSTKSGGLWHTFVGAVGVSIGF